MNRMPIGVNDTGWGGPPARAGRDPEGVFSTTRFLDEAAAAGYSGIELSPGMLEELGDVAALHDALTQRGLTVSGAVIAGHLEDPDVWIALERQARAAARAMAPFGARHLVLIDMLFFDADPPTLNEREWRRLIDTTNRLGGLAAELGLVLAVHQHADTHLETDEQIARFLAETDPSLVSLCLDTGHLAWCDIDPVHFLRCYHDRVNYVHLKNIRSDVLADHRAERLPWVQAVRRGVASDLSDGVVDIPAILATLELVGYDGWAIVETERIPTPDVEPLRMARKALELVLQTERGT